MKLKSFLFLIIALLSAEISSAQVKNNDSVNKMPAFVIQRDSAVTQIADATQKTAKNTEPSYVDKDGMKAANWIFGLIAAIGTFITFFAVKNETKQKQIKKKFQEKIMLDLIRHLYRNKVVVCTLRWKLNEKEKVARKLTEKYNLYYPSEEHLLKLKMLPEDLRLDRFENAPEHYDMLHKLELYFRNYNVEIDVALDHLKSKNLSVEVKDRDLDTLEFKSGFLTAEIDKLMLDLKLPHDIFDCLQKESYDKIHEKDGSVKAKIQEAMNTGNFKKWETENFAVVPKRRNGDYYDKLNLTDCLNRDIAIEYLKEGTINLIKS
jgi:hypothetical protein